MSTTMKIAFPTNDRSNVEEHFGHAKEFAFYVVENGKVSSSEYMTPPPHAPGVIPEFVHSQGADVIITGGMGGMAVNLFKEKGVEVILGATGSIDENLNTFVSGDLASTGSVCDHSHE